jgi:hypothetical protein
MEMTKVPSVLDDGASAVSVKKEEILYLFLMLCSSSIFPSSIFPVVLPKGAVWGAPSGPTNMSADAVYLMIPPLSKAEHTLHFSGQVFNPTDPTYNQATDITCHPIVK